MSARVQGLAGGRLHLNHGPIDLVIKARGRRRHIAAAYAAAAHRFETVLDELMSELPALRRPLTPDHKFAGTVARRMADAVAPFGDVFVTPMAAVAGSVADEILAVMTSAAELDTIFVNNGGDIALHIAPGHSLRIGTVGEAPDPAIADPSQIIATVTGNEKVRGIATSGRHGRSFSLGIADAVTVLGGNAARADVAATVIANAVNIDSPAIKRAPATDLDPDSDLGRLPVTVDVGALRDHEIETALAAGRALAQQLRRRGQIEAGLLSLAGQRLHVGQHRLFTLANRFDHHGHQAA